MLYLDTSALLPYYRSEAHSSVVQRLLASQTEAVLISDLTRLELASALARWVRMGELLEVHAELVERAFDEDVSAGRYLVRPITTVHVELARRWMLGRKTSLRALDALHLATAFGDDAAVVTLDDAMAAAAEQLGLRLQRP